ncbi:MAG: hypothetical protein QOJ39_2364 [Candidatus Eremiobacteraeota bacterium]|nr:hypothetical protein [Candidatus Eremiobacteraeota bacterium]
MPLDLKNELIGRNAIIDRLVGIFKCAREPLRKDQLGRRSFDLQATLTIRLPSLHHSSAFSSRRTRAEHALQNVGHLLRAPRSRAKVFYNLLRCVNVSEVL